MPVFFSFSKSVLGFFSLKNYYYNNNSTRINAVKNKTPTKHKTTTENE